MKFVRNRAGLYLPQYGRSHHRFDDWIDRRLTDNSAMQWLRRGPEAMAMALQSVGGLMIAPDYPAYETGAPNFTATVIDADAEGYGMVFRAPQTGTITGIGAMTGTLTAGDANTLFQLESVAVTSTP